MPASASIVSSSSCRCDSSVCLWYLQTKRYFFNKVSQKHLQNQPGGNRQYFPATAFSAVLVFSPGVVLCVVPVEWLWFPVGVVLFCLCDPLWQGFRSPPLSSLHLSICRIARENTRHPVKFVFQVNNFLAYLCLVHYLPYIYSKNILFYLFEIQI